MQGKIYKKILTAYRIYVGDIRLILMDPDLHLNELTRTSLQNDIEVATLNMAEIKKLAANEEEFEVAFADVWEWDYDIILSFILTDPSGHCGKEKRR